MAAHIGKQDQLKAAQVVARLLKRGGGKSDCQELLRLLELADREAIEQIGDPIGGVCSADPGEVPLATDVQTMLAGDYPFWAPFVRAEGSSITLLKDPGDDYLSEFDTCVLDEIWEQFAPGAETISHEAYTFGPSVSVRPHDQTRNDHPRQVSSPPGEDRCSVT